MCEYSYVSREIRILSILGLPALTKSVDINSMYNMNQNTLIAMERCDIVLGTNYAWL